MCLCLELVRFFFLRGCSTSALTKAARFVCLFNPVDERSMFRLKTEELKGERKTQEKRTRDCKIATLVALSPFVAAQDCSQRDSEQQTR